MRKLALMCLLVSILFLSVSSMALGDARQIMEEIKYGDKFYICAHRGYSSDYPENTLLAFYEAIRVGVDMIECDIRLTKDNVPVIIHDERVDRTTNGKGLVSEMTVAQLKELDAGSNFGKVFEGIKIPTFEELCELVVLHDQDLLLNLDIKVRPAETAKNAIDEIMKIVKQYDLQDNIIVNCTVADVITYARDKYNVATQGYAEYKMQNFVEGPDGTYSKMWTAGVEIVFFGNTAYYSKIVQQFKDMGIVPHSYVTNDEESVNFVIDCGFRFTACDDPVPALRVAEERGLR